MQNWKKTVISQYANSPVLLALIESWNADIDPSANITAFYNLVWNINTAIGYGLDIWGRIVGINRVLSIPTGQYLGYKEAGAGAFDAFGQSPFYSINPASSNYSLSDDAYRKLILIKALSNISNSSIKTYNTILKQLFPGRGNAYIGSAGGMQARLTFEFSLLPFEIALLKQSGAFVSPTGVQFQIMDIQVGETFGFTEAGVNSAGFNNGVFFKGYE